MNAHPTDPISPDSPSEPEQPSVPEGWNKLPVEHLPMATFWPAGLALATTFIFWGFITSWVVLTVGLGLFGASLAGWVADIRHERKHHP